MHHIVKLMALVLAVFSLCGCSLKKTKVEYEQRSYETENEIVDIEVPKISGLSDREFEDLLNDKYDEAINDELNSFLNESKEADNPDGKCELFIKQSVKYNKNSLLSIVSECFKYTKGLNGVSTRMVVNIDTEKNIQLTLGDLFTDGEYKNMLNSRLEKLSNEDIYSDLWERPTITDSQNEYFYFSDSGLVIFYPPYELSYYSRGFVEFTIPYSELYGYLKPEYAVLY